MNQIIKFLNECGIFYLATMEEDQPRVRPFGAVAEFEGKLYLCTNNTKEVYRQLLANPKAEVSASLKDCWIRLTGKLIPDHRIEAREAMLTAKPSLRNMYAANDGKFEVLYFTDAKATFYSFTKAPEEIQL